MTDNHSKHPWRIKGGWGANIRAVLPLVLWTFLPSSALAQRVFSVFPIGVSHGTRLEIQVRGTDLSDASALWFDCDAIQGSVLKVEKVEPEKDAPERDSEKKKAIKPASETQRVIVGITIKPEAALGTHMFRVITPAGVTNPLPLLVNSELVELEVDVPHDTPASAQPVKIPSIINGKSVRRGELDYYVIDVSKGQELRFEVLTGTGAFTTVEVPYKLPGILLCEQTGTWFQPGRCNELEVDDQSTFFFFPKHNFNVIYYLPRIRHRFDRAGKYFVVVKTQGGDTSPDHSYELRMTISNTSGEDVAQWFPQGPAHTDEQWTERAFERKLLPARQQQLWSRGVRTAPTQEPKSLTTGEVPDKTEGRKTVSAEPSQEPATVAASAEQEPNDIPSKSNQHTVPRVLEGAISSPDDVDYFKFYTVRQTLAFEIETPEVLPPHFAPRLAVVDEAGTELFNNMYRRIAGDGDDWIKSLEPKTIFSFDKEGTYFLRITDLTTQRGGPRFKYRVLVRPAVPHIGEVGAKTWGISMEPDEDRINLHQGEVRKLTIIACREEGFDGDIALTLLNLPRGVELLPTSAVLPEIMTAEPGPVYDMRGAEHKERYRPQRLLTTIYLRAAEDAPVTSALSMVRLVAIPILNGHAGTPITVQKLPFMVIRADAKDQKAGLRPDES